MTSQPDRAAIQWQLDRMDEGATEADAIAVLIAVEQSDQPQAVSVNLHAWKNAPSDDCEYCDASEETPDGWCIYTRTDFDNEGKGAPFDIFEELDFPDYASALAAGQERAARLGVPLQEY